jgi:hypothetical protein
LVPFLGATAAACSLDCDHVTKITVVLSSGNSIAMFRGSRGYHVSFTSSSDHGVAKPVASELMLAPLCGRSGGDHLGGRGTAEQDKREEFRDNIGFDLGHPSSRYAGERILRKGRRSRVLERLRRDDVVDLNWREIHTQVA